MTDAGAASPTGRPLCACHGEPMDVTGQSRECAVKRRARRKAQYAANPTAETYARMRRGLRARIALKRAHVEELENRLREAQDTR